MARNEEKQLARLNRFYLEKQKQEELKKRPPRPRLDTLNTSRDVRKWLPSITRDIEFYVKQMEVPCYTDGKIADFSERIQRLKGEYRAFLHKLKRLEPSTPLAAWAHRPYENRKRPAPSVLEEETGEADGGERDDAIRDAISDVSSAAHSLAPTVTTPVPQTASSRALQSGSWQSGFVPIAAPVLQTTASLAIQSGSQSSGFIPIATPVLLNMPSRTLQSGFEPPAPVVWNANPDTQDTPLAFGPSAHLAIGGTSDADRHSEFGSNPHLADGDTSHMDKPLEFGSNPHLPIGDICCKDRSKSDGAHGEDRGRHSVSLQGGCVVNLSDKVTGSGVNSQTKVICTTGGKGAEWNCCQDEEEVGRTLDECQRSSPKACIQKALSDACVERTSESNERASVAVSQMSSKSSTSSVSGVCSQTESTERTSERDDQANVAVSKMSFGSSKLNLLNLDYSDSSDESS